MPTFNHIEIPLEDLLLDPNNYRYQDTEDFVQAAQNRFHEATVQSRAEAQLRDDTLRNLKDSILFNGFLPVERIVVRPYQPVDGKYVVLEGNRRLAALRWIKSDHDAGVDVSEELLSILEAVPVLVLAEADETGMIYESIMGIRHVGGIKVWGGYQRAKLVASLRDNHTLEPAEVAARLGLSTREITRRYRAFSAFKQMEEDEEFGEFASPELYPVFHEAVSLPVVRDWLGWDENNNRFSSQEELRAFYELITPCQQDDSGEEVVPKITGHRQVRELPAILGNEEAKSALLDPKTGLDDALAIVKHQEMHEAWRSRVREATEALRSVAVIELQELPEEDLDGIKTLIEVGTQLLESYKKLSG